ncbi:enzymatic polyprotein, partial [Trifolium medium]|nr:enzymatic polyprotein [Trifolium medium]
MCGQDGHLSNECRNTTSVCYNYKKPGHFARDCKAPQAGLSVNATQGARPTVKGRVYCMGAKVSGQASNAIHEDCQIA